VLGQRAQAMSLIREAIAQGSLFTILHANVDFESMHDYQPFLDFMKPKG
jgi:hypothetical protein